MPAQTESATAAEYTYYVDGGATRNYTMYYDTAYYAPLWVAYPMKAAYAKKYSSNEFNASWSNNPDIDDNYEVSVWKGTYDVAYGSTSYNRGHLIPDASRNGYNSEMVKQAYYATNSVPQIQDGFNGGIWSSLEDALRGQIKESNYELYVVTGVVFRKADSNESITYINPACDTKSVPVPNYFYKVALKVKTNASGVVTSASTVGFWFEHKTYSDSYTNYAVSVDQIEQWTGFDFFPNLPDSVESSAEGNSSWSTFQNF